MKPWKTLDRAQAPGGGELSLAEHDGQYVIRIDGKELMSSRSHGSEKFMAKVGLEGRPPGEATRVLVGGLGFGYTLRAVLDVLPPRGRVVVAEISSAVMAWNRERVGGLAGHPLDDPRTSLEELDVLALMRRDAGAFEVILLDLDNGPAALTLPANAALYREKGIAVCMRALAPRGTLVVWSAGPDASYVARLKQGGFDAEARTVDAHPGSPKRHTLFIGRRRG
jgi:spermidine synthase